MDAFFGSLASFGPLGCSFGCPREQKGVPKAFEGDLVDIVKTYVLLGL